jgi:hypothetical protein
MPQRSIVHFHIEKTKFVMLDASRCAHFGGMK